MRIPAMVDSIGAPRRKRGIGFYLPATIGALDPPSPIVARDSLDASPDGPPSTVELGGLVQAARMAAAGGPDTA